MTGCRALRKNTTAIPYDTLLPNDSVAGKRAKALNLQGLRAFHKNQLPKAEQLFRETLRVDPGFGPAHNNLGQIYLSQHQLYLAAWEFEYASNLMPELVEPTINQGLAYETGERLERAAQLYQQAYHQDPHHPVAIASLVRTKIKLDDDPSEIGFLLSELVMHDGRQEWVEWAKRLLATRYPNHAGSCIEPSETLPTESSTNAVPLDDVISPFGNGRSEWGDEAEESPLFNSPLVPADVLDLTFLPMQPAADDSASMLLMKDQAAGLRLPSLSSLAQPSEAVRAGISLPTSVITPSTSHRAIQPASYDVPVPAAKN